VNSGEPQSGPDLKDHEEIDIASISTTNDRSKMDRYDGPPNSLNLAVRGIDRSNHSKADEIARSPKFPTSG
jgi:hypothetical protein